jgi:hypothetical protein
MWFPFKVQTLLAIWLSCLDQQSDISEISTPRYLYNDEEGRKCILRKLTGLSKNNKTVKVKQLTFYMYSFYNTLVEIKNKGGTPIFPLSTQRRPQFIFREGMTKSREGSLLPFLSCM